jgi:hypothetical protein
MKKYIIPSLCVAIALSACGKKNGPPGSAVKPYEPKSLAKPDLFLARVNGRYGFIDKTGTMVLPPRYLRALEFSEGLAPVQDLDQKWGFIDTTGRMAIKPLFNLALPFSEGLASVRAPDRFGCINKAGDLVIAAKFGGVGQFNGGLAQAVFEQTVNAVKIRGWGFIKTDGIFQIPPSYDAVGAFGEGVAPAKIFTRKWGYIDKDQKIVIEPVFESANQFSEGLASVESSHETSYKWGFIDHQGKYVVEPRFTLARTFSEGLIGVQVNSAKWGFADKTGKFVIQPDYDDVGQFHNGLALVRLGLKERYIDPAGKTIWEEK